VLPSHFLPWFGAADLTRLFRAGLSQSLQQLASWDAQGIRLNLGVNLPLDVMLQPDCSLWIGTALAAARIAPDRLYLEILEGGEFDDGDRRDGAVRQLAAVGVRLVMDDLGSGYSSLLRLRTLPFHTVKIDQGLVREAGKDPERVIGFVGALVQLAQSLGLWVVVEGLESPDLVEAATVLGADAGQGYALARPMGADMVANWVQAFRSEVDPNAPRTPLGLLAQAWVEQHRSAMADHSARQVLRNTRKHSRHAGC
jgi:EAL domain-containing protein (putative c-di-GMP-specific phosphodiesterase class I)